MRRRGLLVLAAALPLAARAQGSPAVSLETAWADAEAGRVLLVDIRETDEHRATGVAVGARLLPMSQLGARLGELPADPSRPVYLICNTQNRSRRTVEELRRRYGWTHVQYVEGGMSEWVRRGWPVVAAPR